MRYELLDAVAYEAFSDWSAPVGRQHGLDASVAASDAAEEVRKGGRVIRKLQTVQEHHDPIRRECTSHPGEPPRQHAATGASRS